LDQSTRRAFSRFGAFVRTTARRSIRPAGKRGKVSKPGEPPRSRTGLLKRFIFYSFDFGRRSVVIGPQRLTGRNKGNAPRLLEHGGTAKSRRHTAKIDARPFMGPAFDKGKQKLASFWKHTIKN
jgi:hypothetical protein